jgi:hypothetical protein
MRSPFVFASASSPLDRASTGFGAAAKGHRHREAARCHQQASAICWLYVVYTWR